MAQMKEQIKTPEKEPSNEETANRCDTGYETLVIRMLAELNECGCKIKEQMQATQSEMKQNIQGTNSEGKENRTHINDWNKRNK